MSFARVGSCLSMNSGDKHLVWHEISRKKIVDCKIFDCYSVKREDFDGVVADFTIIDAPNWVTVIAPILDNGIESIVMVRQFRHGSEQLTIEFPAGMVEKGESPEVAAARELLEETGIKATKLTLLGAGNPNPAFLNNISYTYLAEELLELGVQSLDENESIDIVKISEKELFEQLGSGEFDNGIMVSAFFYYQKWKNRIKK